MGCLGHCSMRQSPPTSDPYDDAFCGGGESQRGEQKKRVTRQGEAVVARTVVVGWGYDGKDDEVVSGGEPGELLGGGSQALASMSGWIPAVRPRPWQARATGSRRGRDGGPDDGVLGGEEIEAVPPPAPCAADVKHEDARRRWWMELVGEMTTRERANGNAFWFRCWRSWGSVKLSFIGKASSASWFCVLLLESALHETIWVMTQNWCNRDQKFIQLQIRNSIKYCMRNLCLHVVFRKIKVVILFWRKYRQMS
jgi:hypothetical protein